MARNYLGSRDRFYEAMDRRGVIEYTTGDAGFDEQIAEKWNHWRPEEMSFVESYSKEEIQKDLGEIKRIENSPSYKKERSPVSVMAEIAITQGVNDGLLGPEISASITSRYDDVKLGADMVVAMPNPDSTGKDLVFCLDVTVSGNKEILDKKLSSEFIRLRKEKRTQLKYYKGVKEPINRYIVGIPPEQVKELADILMRRKDNPEGNDLIKKELAEELINQARWQAAYVLARHDIMSLDQAEKVDDFLAFFDDEKNQKLIESKLSPSLFEGVTVNRSVMELMFRQMEGLEQKEKRDSIVSNPSMVGPVDFLTRFRPEQLLGLQRVV